MVGIRAAGSASPRSLRQTRGDGGQDGKGTVAIGVTDDLTGRYAAGTLIKSATAALGGQGGGGRPDMAQGGGPDGSNADEAIAAIRALI